MLNRTNKDLDPVPRRLRKWGVTSFITYWISDAFKEAHSSRSMLQKMLTRHQRRDMAIRLVHHRHRSYVARIARHRRTRLLYHFIRHCLQRCDRRDSPCPISDACACQLRVLGIVPSNHKQDNTLRILVCHPEHEWRECCARDVGSDMAQFLDAQEPIPASQGIKTNTMISFFLFWLLSIPL